MWTQGFCLPLKTHILPFIFFLALFPPSQGDGRESLWNNSMGGFPFDLRENLNGVPLLLPKRLLEWSPPFAPTDSLDESCRNDSLQYLRDLYNFDLRALSIYDASAKLPSGILRGNVNQFGDMDLCLKSEGKYCLAHIDVKLSGTESHILHTVNTLMHSHFAFKSTIFDPGHRVPRFGQMQWAVCVPKSCGHEEVERSLKTVAETASSETGFKATVYIKPEMCQTTSDSPLPTLTKIVGGLFIGLTLLILVATYYEYMGINTKENDFSGELLKSFSLIKNCKKLFSVDVPADDISSVHGIRFLNAMMLFFSHKSMAVFYNPYINRTGMAEALGRPWTVIARAASLYTDPFIMMSGLLTSYSFGKQLLKGQSINVPKEIFSRVVRLLPTLGALILFCTFILPYMGSGPQWPLVINHHAELCKMHWWKNMLFIHNYFGFQNMCLTHTHHIGIDTQLFFTSPILVYMVYKWPRQGLMALLGIGLGSTVLRYYATFVKQLNLYVYFGNSISQMFQTADYSYILPTHRATVYVMGIALGYFLRVLGRDVKIKKSHLTLGWLIAICMVYQSMIHPAKMGDRFYIYDRIDAANYAAFAPITWCLFFIWIVFISHTGNGGWVSTLASWKGWQITTRLAYTFYLTQFPVFFFNVGQVRNADNYSIQLIIDLKEMIAVVIATTALTLFVEMPFQNLRILFLKKSSISTKKLEQKVD